MNKSEEYQTEGRNRRENKSRTGCKRLSFHCLNTDPALILSSRLEGTGKAWFGFLKMQCPMPCPEKGREVALPDDLTSSQPIHLSVLKETWSLSEVGHFPLCLQIVVLLIHRDKRQGPRQSLKHEGTKPHATIFLYICPQFSHLSYPNWVLSHITFVV